MDIPFASLEESWPIHRQQNASSRPSTSWQGGSVSKVNRPKSVPNSINSGPRKADLVCQLEVPTSLNNLQNCSSSIKADCSRVIQLEQSPERKKLHVNAAFGVKKTPRPAWQNHTDSEALVPFAVSPGYVLSRSKTKFHVQLTEVDSPKEKLTETPPRAVGLASVERDSLVSLLQQQIDDLVLALEEEKLNHKETKRQDAENMKVKLTDLSRYYKNEIEMLEKKNLKKLTNIHEEHVAEMADFKNRSDTEINERQREIELLQAAFEAYKIQLMEEMNEKLRQSVDRVTQRLLDDAHNQMEELRSRLIAEKLAEKADTENVYQEKLSRLKRDYKQQIIDLRGRYSESATDMEKMKQTEASLKETQKDLNELQDLYQNTCLQLDGCRLEVDQLKMKMIEWEEKFDGRIKQVDENYREEIDERKKQLSELRILYIKKCSELHDLKHLENLSLSQRVMSAKETMKIIIETRARTDVSLASSSDPELERLHRRPKTRPSSAPLTRFEVDEATVNAGLVAQPELPETHCATDI